MRGHAQLIPFGLRRSIISLVSHPKLYWFLQDIDAVDWAVDVNQENVEDALVEGKAPQRRRD